MDVKVWIGEQADTQLIVNLYKIWLSYHKATLQMTSALKSIWTKLKSSHCNLSEIKEMCRNCCHSAMISSYISDADFYVLILSSPRRHSICVSCLCDSRSLAFLTLDSAWKHFAVVVQKADSTLSIICWLGHISLRATCGDSRKSRNEKSFSSIRWKCCRIGTRCQQLVEMSAGAAVHPVKESHIPLEHPALLVIRYVAG